MNTHHNFDRIASEWLSDGPSELSDRVLDAALDEVHLTRQRPATRVPWRFPPMTSQLKLAAAAAAVVVAAVGTVIVLRGPSAVGSPGAASPTPSSSPCVIQTVLNEPVGRQDCRYTTSAFRPLLSLTGDVRWTPVIEGPQGIQLNANLPGGRPRAEGLAFTVVDRLAVKPCQASGMMTDHSTVAFSPKSAGGGPADFFTWLASKTPLKVPSPVPTSIGGHQGLETTVVLPGGSLPACGGAVLYTWHSPAPGSDSGQQGVGVGLTWRLAAIDVNGTLVTLETWAPPERFATFEAIAEQFLAGFRFE